jgi:hypothetical protein
MSGETQVARYLMNKIRYAAVTAAAVALAGCAAAGHPASHATTPAVPAAAKTSAPVPSAAQLAVSQAVAAECLDAQAIDASMTAASTVGGFASGVSGWEAQLTAASHIPMTGVPQGANPARVIQLDYAEAGFALAFASQYDNHFGPHFRKGKVSRGYSTATGKLQDVLNRCAAAGQPTS